MKKSLFSAIFMTLLATATVATAQIQMTFGIAQPTCHGYTNGSVTVFAVGGAGAYTYAWSTGQTTQTSFGIGAGDFTVTVTDAAQVTATGAITVSEPSAVTAAITATDLDCSGTSGTLTASGFGGTPPYTYAWTGPNTSNAEVVVVVAPGNYFVTVTDANGCAGVGSFAVATALTLDVVAVDIPCAIYPDGGSANAIATGGLTPYTYSWSSGGTTALVTGLGAGPHICTVTSANGCVAIDADNVDIPSPLEVVVTWLTPACGGNNNGSAIVAASGGTPPYSYTWTSGPSGPLPVPLVGPSQTGLEPGQYYVCTFDSNHCQKDLWIEIPATNGLDVQLVVNSATCVGIDNATATAVVSPPGSGYVYEWTLVFDSVTTQVSGQVQLTGLAAGTVVSVTVTDPVSGCSGTASGIVGAHNNIEIAVTDVDIVCAGGFGSAAAVASQGTPQYQYTWYNNGIAISNEPSIDSLLAGAYLVSVVDSIGCMAQAVADIGIESEPHALIDGDSVLVCGDSLSIVQFTNLSYDTYNQITSLVWTVHGPSIDTVIVQQNQIVFQLPVDETITVQLVATSGLGCSDTTILSYNVPGFPDISLSLDSTTINCVGDPVGIDVIGGDSTYVLVWAPQVTLNPNPLHVLVSPLVTTTYVLTATDGNACTTSDSITIAPLDSLFQLFVTDTLIETCADSVLLFATTSIPATIVWSQDDQIFIGNPIKVPATPLTTIYTVSAFAGDSCFLFKNVSVTGYGVDLSLDPNVDLSICEGDSLPLAVVVTPMSDSLSYHWSVTAPAVLSDSTAANPILTGPPGTYTVTVVVTRVVCSDTLQFQVEIIPGFDLDGHVLADLCKGLSVGFTNDSGMAGLWNFGDGSAQSDAQNPTHLYDTSGQYMVVFTPVLQECVAPWDSMINVLQDTLTADISHLVVDCAFKSVIQFKGTTNNPGIFDWDWSFSNGTPDSAAVQNPIITYFDEGMYVATLIVTDINQCTAMATDTVFVEIVSDEIDETLRICPGDSIRLNPVGIDSMASYHWTSVPFDPTLEPLDPNPMVTPTVPTTYSVEIAQGLCKLNYSVLVAFKDGSDVELPGDTIVCSGDTISITAQSNGATGYEWSNTASFSNIFATTQTVHVLPNGTYYVRTTGAECFDVDSIHIEVGAPEIQVMPTDNDICLGESATLMLSNLIPGQLLQYTWDPALPNVPGPIVTPSETTTYTVTVTNQFGCTATLSYTVNVTEVSVLAEAEPDTVSLQNPTTVLTATAGGNGTVIGFSWSPAGTLSNPNAAETEATPLQTTTYTVTVTSAEGCISTDSVTVYYRQTECIEPFVFIPKAFTPNQDGKNDHFIVLASGMTALKFIVWNRWGEIVYETNDPSDIGWDGTYKGKPLTPDSFAWYVQLTCGNGDVFESKGNVTLLK